MEPKPIPHGNALVDGLLCERVLEGILDFRDRALDEEKLPFFKIFQDGAEVIPFDGKSEQPAEEDSPDDRRVGEDLLFGLREIEEPARERLI